MHLGEAAARDAQVLVNWSHPPRDGRRFDAVHTYAEQVALAASAHGARLVHVSAIGADENSPRPLRLL
jgi:NADH dehydrogenase